MMAQNLHHRKKHAISTSNQRKTQTISVQKRFAKLVVQFTIVSLTAIAIILGSRFVYHSLNSSKTIIITDKIDRDDDSNSDIINGDNNDLFYLQPIVSLDQIPHQLYTISHDHKNCQNLNPKWTINYYDEKLMINFLKTELKIDTLKLFKDLETATRILRTTQLFKYGIINKYGGLYLDRLVECKGNINEWLNFFYPKNNIYFNNWVYRLNDNKSNKKKYVDIDMIITLASGMPFSFANYAFFSKSNNPILDYIIDSILEQPKDSHILSIFTDSIQGFVDAFTDNSDEALKLHKLDQQKAHVVTLYINEKAEQTQMINILVLELSDLWKIARRGRGPILKN